jgi:hypothetical protein
MGGMKVLYCPHCGDVVRLFPERRSCKCGKSWGHYLDDNSTTVQTWPSLSLGIANPDFQAAQQSFAASPETFSPLLAMRCWINPLSEPDVKLVKGIPIGDEHEGGDEDNVTDEKTIA